MDRIIRHHGNDVPWYSVFEYQAVAAGWIEIHSQYRVIQSNPSQCSNTEHLPRIIVYNIPFIRDNNETRSERDQERNKERDRSEKNEQKNDILYKSIQDHKEKRKEGADICTICQNEFRENKELR